MESLNTAFTAVCPMMIYMVIGWLIRKRNYCTKETLRNWNQLIFQVFIPLSLFMSICQADLLSLIQPKLFIFIEALLIGQSIITWFALKKVITNRVDHATVVQGISRSNYVLFGMALAANLCDADGVALVSALAAMVVPTINIEAVVMFEIIRGKKVKPWELLLHILQNPIVAAGLLGIAFSLLRIPVPVLIQDSLRKLGNTATPIALLILGGILSFSSIRRHRHMLIITAVCRMVLLPLTALTTGILLGFRGNELIAILAVFGAPTAVASTPTAQVMGGNAELAGEIVAVTSVGSLFTVFMFVLLLSAGGFI